MDHGNKTIVAATRNKYKIKEIEKIIEEFGLSIISRDDAGIPPFEVEETGTTFEENSYIKAKAIFDVCHKMTMADDSGIMVDALDGAPGVYSARFAGPEEDDDKNVAKVMELMKDVPDEKRGAKFVSVITLILPDGNTVVCRGECKGTIAHELRGTAGFGYDPIFIPEGYNDTFGMLGQELKNRISHRSRALAALAEKLREMGFEK